MVGPPGLGPNTAPLAVSIQNHRSLAQEVSTCYLLCLLHPRKEAVKIKYFHHIFPIGEGGDGHHRNHREVTENKLARKLGKIRLEMSMFLKKTKSSAEWNYSKRFGQMKPIFSKTYFLAMLVYCL